MGIIRYNPCLDILDNEFKYVFHFRHKVLPWIMGGKIKTKFDVPDIDRIIVCFQAELIYQEWLLVMRLNDCRYVFMYGYFKDEYQEAWGGGGSIAPSLKELVSIILTAGDCARLGLYYDGIKDM